MTPRNDWEFRIFGMKRSGHHAIVIWLASHFPKRTAHFINDVAAFGDPFVSHANTECTTLCSDSFVHRPEEKIQDERGAQKHCLMYNYEGPDLSLFAGRHPIPQKLETVGGSSREFTLLILRDPFNLAASWYRAGFSQYIPAAELLDRWICHAKEFVGSSDYLGPKLSINYNRWFADGKYRREISNALRLQFTDAGLNRVSRNGDGSSWDRMEFDHRAQKMKVLERWQGLAHCREFRNLFHGRNDVHKLSEQIFGHIPDTERLLGTRCDAVRLPRVVRLRFGDGANGRRYRP